MRVLRFLLGVVGLIALTLQATPVIAAGPKTTQGLSIAPLRQEITVDPGKSKSGCMTVGNLTDKQIIVNLSVQGFSVTDYEYDYEFKTPPDKDWVKLRQTQIILAPHKTDKVWYDVVVPEKTTPGGYYFSLFASTQIDGPGLPGTIQAAMPLYMKVSGQLIRTGVLQNDSIPFFVTGKEIPYKFDVKNTGNVHFTAYFYGQADGLFVKGQPDVGTSHLLMPGKIRTVDGDIPSPLLPGIYRVTYGYKVDFASIITVKTAYILFIPPWSLVAAFFSIIAARWIWQRRKKILKIVKPKDS